VVRVVFFREDNGSVPVLRFLYSLEQRVLAKCRARLTLLQEYGHQLRRPEAGYFGNGIYELRISRAGHRYRILYAFHDRDVVLLSAFAKAESRVPVAELRLARFRLEQYASAPIIHSHEIGMP
jgi:phage-related protein